MPYPTLTITEPEITESRLTAGAVAKRAGTSEHLVKKLLRGGYLDLSAASVEAFVRAGHVSAGGLLPVLKTDSPSPVNDSWRQWAGDGLSLNNFQWVDAQRGDWTGVAVDKVLSAGCILGGLGGLVTGVLKVTGHEDIGDNRKDRFEAVLIGRLTSNLAQGQLYLSPTVSEEDRSFARSVIGKRFESLRGTQISFI